MAISPSTRWEVFRRDGFRCRYCGRASSDPGVVLVVDHVHARARGGDDTAGNLATACHECNAGKSDRSLDGKLRERRTAPSRPPGRPRKQQPRKHNACLTPWFLALQAAYMGESYDTLRSIHARAGRAVPPARAADRKLPSLVTADDQQPLVNAMNWGNAGHPEMASYWPILPHTPAIVLDFAEHGEIAADDECINWAKAELKNREQRP